MKIKQFVFSRVSHIQNNSRFTTLIIIGALIYSLVRIISRTVRSIIEKLLS